MPESNVFDWVSNQLEHKTSLSRLEARGTVRLVLKDAGLDPASVSVHQMVVVLERLLAGALNRRRIDGADEICRQLAEDLRKWAVETPQKQEETAYDVFERLDAQSTRRPKR